MNKNNIELKNTLNLNKNNIFNKYINNTYKLTGLKPKNVYNFEWRTNFLPSESKEWTNNIYYFNSNYIKNIPVYDLNINKLLRNYFELYLNRINTNSRFLLAKKKYSSFNKIFVSKAELKHTSSKVIITVYVFNRERIILKKKLKKLIRPLKIIWNNFYFNKGILKKYIKKNFRKELVFIKRIKLRFDINNLKFKDILLYKLSRLLSKFYKKKVEFNIISLKSFQHNSNILTDILRRKMVHRNARVFKITKFILKKIENIAKSGRIYEWSRNFDLRYIYKNIDTLHNWSYKNINIKKTLKKVGLNKTIKNLYNTYENLNNEATIFNSIEYKRLGGIKLKLKGRLTKRYRADRAVSNIISKGVFRNKKRSPFIYRGVVRPNLGYSMDISKRRIGAFAVKGWIHGKK